MSAEAPGSTRNAVDAQRFGDVLSAEILKIRTLPATWIALAIAFIANTLLGILAASDVVRIAGQDGQIPIGQLGTVMLSPVYVFIGIAVYAAGSEYSAGQLRVSLAAVPNRKRLGTAKLVAAAAVSILAAIPAVLPGYLIQHAAAINAGTLPIGGAATGLAALFGVYLLLSLCGFGFAIIAKSVVTPLAVLFITPVLISPTLQGTLPDVVRLLPHEAALSLLDKAGDPGVALGRTAGLVMLVVWAGVFVGSAWVSLTRRDG